MEENKNKPIMLYIGCGHDRLKDFIHVEINLGKNKSGPPDILADISDYIPFNDNKVDLVYSKATMEHLTYSELINCLLESHRILKRGGRVRMVVPDFDKMIDDYKNKITRPEIKSPGFPCEDYLDSFIGRILYFDHRYLHNFETLSKALKKTGFDNIKICQPGDCGINDANEELLRVENGRLEYDIIIEAEKLDKIPSAKRTEKQYPKNPIAYFLAKFFNVKIMNFIERKSRFPQKFWFKTFLKFNKSKYLK